MVCNYWGGGYVVPLREVKKGDYFLRIRKDGSTMNSVYIREDYDRSTKKYFCGKFDDISAGMQLKGDTPVLIGFTF